MPWLKKGVKFLPDVSKKELQALYKEEKKSKPKLRLLVALLRKEGRTLEDISFSVQKPKTTIHDWIKRLEDNSLEGIYDTKQTGKPTRLTQEQTNELKKVLSSSPMEQGIPFKLWMTSTVQYVIHKRFEVTYRPRNVRKIVKKLGFTLQKPRQRNRKASTEAQKEFKKNIKQKFNIMLNSDLRASVLMKPISEPDLI